MEVMNEEQTYVLCGVFCTTCGCKDVRSLLGDAKLKDELSRLRCTRCNQRNSMKLCSLKSVS